jgi:hypothetical protein
VSIASDQLLHRVRAVHHHLRPFSRRQTFLYPTLAAAAVLLTVVAPAAAQDAGGGRRHRGRPPATADTPPAAQPVEQPAPQPEARPEPSGIAQAAAPSDAGSSDDVIPVGAEASTESSAPVAAVEGEGEAEAEPGSRMLRLSFTGGLGRVTEAEAADAANFAEGALRVAYIGVENLEVALDGSLQFYDRAYVLNLPSNGEGGALRVDVEETRLRAGLTGGYNVLGLAGIDREDAEVAPYLRFELDQYRNDVVPQSVFGIGLGLNAAVRIANALHLEAGILYSYAAATDPPCVCKRLAFGTVLGELRYGAGIVISVPPSARVRLGYEGEWVALEHSNSYQNSLRLGLDFDI